MEYINNLLDYKDMKIYQNPDWFKFSLDSVLLPNFVTINPRTKNIIDLGTGNAPIPLILTTRTKANIYGVEVQKELADLAMKSVKINNLEKQINILNVDVRDLKKYFKSDCFDIVTVNPPYFKKEDDSVINNNMQKSIARHEIMLTLEDVLDASSYLLKNGGLLAMIHRTDRLVEIICLFKKYNIEPKRIRFIYPKKGSESNMVLIEGAKNGNPGLKLEPPLFVHDENNGYSEEVRRQFQGG